MESRANFPNLLNPAVRKWFGEREAMIPELRPQVFHEYDSQKATELDASLGGLTKLTEKPEGTPLTYEDRAEGFPVTYTHRTFAKGGTVTHEMWEDDQSNQIRKMPRALANARVRHSEQMGADILNFSFTAGGGGIAPFTSGDAKALFATNHQRIDGGTAQSNMTTMDLAEDSLETAFVGMRSTLDNKGQLQMSKPSLLIVPPTLEKEARILLESQARTGTANNDINPYKGALKLMVWDYIGAAGGGSDTAWFVLDEDQHELNWFWRERPNLDGPEYDFDTKTGKWSVQYRASVGFSDWQGLFGSKGDNS
jgi:hypothetical protein